MIEQAPKYLFIVDQGPVYIELLDYIFKKDFAYRFLNLKTGDETLSNLDLQPEVIVLNSQINDIPGMDLIREIRKKLPHIFIMVLLADHDDPSDWFEAGADDFIRLSELTGTSLALQIENHLTRDTLLNGMQQKVRQLADEKVFYLLLGLLVGAALLYYL